MNEPAVAIGYLERFAADFERESGMMSVPECAPANGIKVAVIGLRDPPDFHSPATWPNTV